MRDERAADGHTPGLYVGASGLAWDEWVLGRRRDASVVHPYRHHPCDDRRGSRACEAPIDQGAMGPAEGEDCAWQKTRRRSMPQPADESQTDANEAAYVMTQGSCGRLAERIGLQPNGCLATMVR
jgi:hypothetical protein